MNRLTVRRFKKLFSEHKIKILILLIISLFFISATGFAIFKTEFNIGGTATIELPDEPDEPTTCEYDLSASYEVKHSWVAGNKNQFIIDLTFENNGSNAVTGWEFQMVGPTDLEMMNGNAEFVSGDGYILISNMNWNGNIAAGGNLTIELTIATAESQPNIKYISMGDCLVYEDKTISGDVGSDQLRGIFLSSTKENLKEGATLQLTASKIPSIAPGKVVWSSSDTSIARVNQSGVVTGVSSGTAVITASIGSISANCTINVRDVSSTDDDKFTFTFTPNPQGSNSMQFSLDVKNNTNVSYTKIKFDTSLPMGTEYQLWSNPGFSVSGQTFNLNMLWGNVLEPLGTIQLTGNIILPNGYNVNDYLHPIFDNVVILE